MYPQRNVNADPANDDSEFQLKEPTFKKKRWLTQHASPIQPVTPKSHTYFKTRARFKLRDWDEFLSYFGEIFGEM